MEYIRTILELSALAFLVGYLYRGFCLRHRVWQRYREDMAREKAFREKWRPTVLDTSSISPRIEQLRHDYVAALHSRPHYARLIALVRDTILRLPYFRKLREANQTSGGIKHRDGP